MFQDLDASLASLLAAELPIRDVAVSFAGPDDQFPPSSVRLPAVSLFLYDIRENLGLRDSDGQVERQGGGFVRLPPPARVDCSYLITAWPSESAPDPAADEHRLLGAVLKVLVKHRKFPADHLRGELAGQQPPVPTKIIAENQLHSLSEFWQAMGGRPKAALHYRLTLSLDVVEPVPVGPEVTKSIVRIDAGAR